MDVGLDDSVNFGSNQILFIIFISGLLCVSVVNPDFLFAVKSGNSG